MINSCHVGFGATLRKRGKIMCALNLRIFSMFCFDLLQQGLLLGHNDGP
jgi:hypothetical protein